MPQRTLVAFYGDKAPSLSSFVGSCQWIASSVLGGAFMPYDIEQVHATIIGLEHSRGSSLQNENFRHLRGRRTEMDIPGFLRYMRSSSDLPFVVRIGGFSERDRPFLSRGEPPYQRAFSVQGDKAVVMGWPCATDSNRTSGDYPQTLDAVRRSAQGFGILHAYHRSESDLDNDFFFRIGLIDRGAVTDGAVRDLEQRVRRHLSRQPPLMLTIGLCDLLVAAYRDERLPVTSTEVWFVGDPGGAATRRGHVSAHFV